MLLAMLLSVFVVAVCTMVHFATLKQVSNLIVGRENDRGKNLALSVGAITTAHVVEAFLYTLAFLWAVRGLNIGDLTAAGTGPKDISVMDYYYFSLVNFTTLGRGDLNPQGHLRFITGIEAFHGFLMITASGSFVLQVMAGKAPLSKSS